VSWRHLIDTRQAKATVDWPRLIIVLVASQVLVSILSWLLSDLIGQLGMTLIILPIAALLIALDVKLGRQDSQDI
jgi:uncharacterized membrane protein YfcA